MTKKTAIIIGGGPAGLTAAYEFLKHTDIHPIVVEMSEYWGGISRTVDYKGNKIDIGGHRFFSKSDTVMQWWNDILPIFSDQENIKITYQNRSSNIRASATQSDEENVMLVRNRKSRIYFNKSFFDYPISLTPATIKKIGLFNTILIGVSYMKASAFPSKEEKTLEQFFVNRFGRRLYEMFFKDYTEKVWGMPCSEISAEWGAQRIKGLSITKTVTHFLKKTFSRKNGSLAQKDTETSLIEYFLYPKYGPGQMWDEVSARISSKGGELHQNKKVVGITVSEMLITDVTITDIRTGEVQTIAADYVISTMPVNELIASLSCAVPASVSEVAAGLRYRDFITVGLLLKRMEYDLEDNWIYIQEPYVKVGRIQVFNNWSPYLVKDADTHWLGLEYFCNTSDQLWQLSEDQMAALAVEEMIELGFIKDSADVLDYTVIKMPKTYPAYFGTYDRFDEISNFTDQFENLFLVGRNGMHKYNNQDHSMLTAIQAVQNIKNGVIDKSNIWSINTEQEYHEEKTKPTV